MTMCMLEFNRPLPEIIKSWTQPHEKDLMMCNIICIFQEILAQRKILNNSNVNLSSSPSILAATVV